MDSCRKTCSSSQQIAQKSRNFAAENLALPILRRVSVKAATRILAIALGFVIIFSFLLATAPGHSGQIPGHSPASMGFRLLDQKVESTRTAVVAMASNLSASSYPHPYNFTISEADICYSRKPDLYILAVVHTAPKNFKKRMVIRDTWGSQRLYNIVKTVVIFAVGKSGDRKTDQMMLAESQKYRDIIQEDFLDSYKNLSLKGVMWLRWVTQHCPQAPFLLKVDDDIFVNIFNLVTHLTHLQARKQIPSKSIMCLLWTRMPVMRDKKSKWYVSREEYSEDYFSWYCSGSAFVLTRELIHPMYLKSRVTPFFWVDDFYLTGLLPRNISGLEYKNIASLYVLKPAELDAKLVHGFALFGHISALQLRYTIWGEILEQKGLKDKWDRGVPLT